MTEKKELAPMEQGQSIYSSMERFEAAQRMAKSLAQSTFVPDAYRNNVPNTLIAIEVAGRYGNMSNAPSVLAVMQNLYVVHGKPAFEAKFVIGLINTCGLFSPLRWEFVGEQGMGSWGCRAVAKDLRSGDVLTGPLVDMELAQREGWIDKKGSKWVTMPEQMLRYRSASFWIKIYAPELLLGMHMMDELQDSQEEESVVNAEVVTDNDPLDSLADQLADENNQGDLKF